MPVAPCDLSSCFLCRHCLPEWKALIALRRETRLFKRGASLFTEGAPVTGIFLILSGAVKVHRQWEGGKELIIRFAGGGDIVGHRGGLEEVTDYPVSATALEATRACFIDTGFLVASLKANGAFAYELLRFYAAELQAAERRMSELAHMDVKGRIASALQALQAAFGSGEDGYILVPVSRQDVASYAGTTYETVFKVFAEWTTAGLIRTEGKRIRILDREQLGSQPGQQRGSASAGS